MAAPRCAGEVRDAEVVAFDAATTVLERLASGDRAAATGARHPLAEVTLLAPHTPRAIFGIGLNYLAHAREQGKEPPEAPIVFMKLPSSAAPPGAPVPCPEVVRRLDYEGELAVVMGAGGEVAGYAVADDVSARDLQAPRAAVDAGQGRRRLLPVRPVDHDRRRGRPTPRTWRCAPGSTASCARTRARATSSSRSAELVAFIGETCTLEPGDLILTGTPSGVGMALDPPRWLASGDVVRIEIERLGAIEHAVA